MLGQVNYQRGLCQRYRNNIQGLSRLCTHTVAMTTPLQRDNQQKYKATLYSMVELQKKELDVAEQMLTRIQNELMAAMRSEKIVTHVIDQKMFMWQQLLAKQEQKIQDGIAAQTSLRQ